MSIRQTMFGVPLSKMEDYVGVMVTSRCNKACSFCNNEGKPIGGDMTLEEFKHIVDQVNEYSRITGKKLSVCISGGEPFLNKDLIRMSRYAARVLGPGRVEITTNMSLLPTTEKEITRLLERLGKPVFNLSIDREHLKGENNAEQRIQAFFRVAKRLGVKTTILNVAKNAYEEKHRWPRTVKGKIPKRLREDNEQDPSRGRMDFYAFKLGSSYTRKELEANAKGKNQPMPLTSSSMHISTNPFFDSQHLLIANNGQAYLWNGIQALFFPQLSVGNWRRESLNNIIQKNVPFKVNMIKGWIGQSRVAGTRGKTRVMESPTREKTRLFARQALRKFKYYKAQRRTRARK